MLTVEDTQNELSKDVEKLYNKPGKGKKEQDYLKHGAVALAMNKAFSQLGWDCITDSVVVLKPAYRCNSAGKADEAGTYFTAIAQVIVTVKARSLLAEDGTFVEVVRTSAGVGQAVGGKSTTEFDAIQNAITAAETAAFKRACRYFGPSTGLTLQFDPGEREAIQAQIEQANQLDKIEAGGPTVIEGIEVSSDMTPPAAPTTQAVDTNHKTPTVQAPAAAPVATPEVTQKPAVNGNGVGHEIPEVLKNLADQEVLNRIAALASDDEIVPTADVKAFQMTLIGAFEKSGGLGLWRTAGLAVGPTAVVKRSCMNSIAQVIEEASVGPGGLEGFLAKFKTPVQVSSTTIIMDGKHVAGPAPTVPAPGKTEVEPSVTTPAAAAPPAPSAPPVAEPAATHGEEMQEMWDESEVGKADRRERYKRMGGMSPELIEILVTTPSATEVTREVGGKVHAFGLARFSRLNQQVDIMDAWKKAGYSFGNGQPRGKHLRAFVDALPD